MSEIINSIPPAEALRKVDTLSRAPTQLEAVPKYYLNGVEDEATPEEVNAATVKALRNEINFGNLDVEKSREEVVLSGYAIARNIGDVMIGRMSKEAFSMVGASRLPFLKAKETSNERFDAFVYERAHGENFTNTPIVSINMDALGPDSAYSERFRSDTERYGVQVKPEDVRTILFMSAVAHEAGHLVQFGVGKYLEDSDDKPDGYSKMSSTFLKLHPELGLTRNHQTNVRIHNERFAEGYGSMVLREMVGYLGYNEADVDKIMKAVSLESMQSPTFEHLDELTEDVSLLDIAKQNGESYYEGDLGYTKPLRPEQIVADLESMSLLIKDDLPSDKGSLVESYKEQGQDTSVEAEAQVDKDKVKVETKKKGFQLMKLFVGLWKDRPSIWSRRGY